MLFIKNNLPKWKPSALQKNCAQFSPRIGKTLVEKQPSVFDE